VILVQQPQKKHDAFAASRVALAASGSVALELALARLPMVVGYRLNPLTEAFLDRVLKVRQVNLVNLLLGRPLVCELLGPNCTPERLAASLAELIDDEGVRAAHRLGYDEAVRRLAGGGVSPSLRAADQILELVAARRCGISGSTARRSAR
jgi:lipid-A-disaccharide synthase